jgi:hypothetical protein
MRGWRYSIDLHRLRYVEAVIRFSHMQEAICIASNFRSRYLGIPVPKSLAIWPASRGAAGASLATPGRINVRGGVYRTTVR